MKKILSLTLALATCSSVLAEEIPVDSTRTYEIDEVNVVAYRSTMRRKDVPNKLEIININDLRTVPAQNLTDIIKKSVNADAVDMQGLTGGIDFRGFAPSAGGINSYTRILIDGVPMSTRNTAATSLQQIQSIEVLKGPFSSLIGSGAMGGVVNMITSQSKGDLRGLVNVGFGSYNTLTSAATLGGNMGKKTDFDLYFDLYNQNLDYKTGRNNFLHMSSYEKKVQDPHSSGKLYNNSRFDKNAGGVRFGYDISNKWRLNSNNDLFYTGNGRANGMLWGMYEQTDKMVFRNAHRIDVTGQEGQHALRISPFFSLEKSRYNNDFGYTTSKSQYEYYTWGLLLQDAVKIGKQTIVYGVDNFSQRYNSRQWNQENVAEAPYQPNYANIQTGVFLQNNLAFLQDRLTAVVGLRYDNILFRTYETPHLNNRFDSKSHHTFNPNVGVKYKLNRHFWVRGSAGRAFLAPDAFKLTGEYTVWGTTYKGNSELKPETSFTYDYGVGFMDSKKAVFADVTLFNTDHRNLIVADYSPLESEGYATYINANKAKIKGLEYSFSIDFGKLWDQGYTLNLYSSYTHIFQSEVITPYERGEKRYVSRDIANFGLEYAGKRVGARFNGRYIGSKLEDNWIYQFDPQTYQRIPFVTANGITVRPSLVDEKFVRLPDFIVFDLFVDYKVTPKLSVAGKICNLWDENYMERDGYYMMGRNYTMMVEYRF